jgi:malate dehydrogenase (oxaloacetate-decarboxylating)(NADP+)
MRETLERLRQLDPTLEVDGEMHGDCAFDAALRTSLLPQTTLAGEANLLVFPCLDAANIAYNLLKTTGSNNVAIGPILLGAAKPVNILTASSTVRRIVNMTALTVMDANLTR